MHCYRSRSLNRAVMVSELNAEKWQRSQDNDEDGDGEDRIFGPAFEVAFDEWGSPDQRYDQAGDERDDKNGNEEGYQSGDHGIVPFGFQMDVLAIMIRQTMKQTAMKISQAFTGSAP